MTNQSGLEAISDQLGAVEASLFALLQAISPTKSPIVVTKKDSPTDVELRDGQKSHEQHETESICMRLAAIQRSLVNFAFPLPADGIPIGDNCHTEKVCVGWRCVSWGPTGNGGTAKCLKYEGIYEYRFVCK